MYFDIHPDLSATYFIPDQGEIIFSIAGNPHLSPSRRLHLDISVEA
jgi:hypothetical protein